MVDLSRTRRNGPPFEATTGNGAMFWRLATYVKRALREHTCRRCRHQTRQRRAANHARRQSNRLTSRKEALA